MSAEDLRANPYVGLRPFFADDSLYFFGREQQTAELLEILRQHRFLGVVGSSGSGKSSLVRAGLLPGLMGGFLVQDRDRWRTVQMKPGDAPICNLAAGLLDALEHTATPAAVARLENDLREGHTDAALEFLNPRLESNANLFLLVDQFEEIFAFRGIQHDETDNRLDLQRRKERARRRAEAADFVDLLLALADQRKLPIYVALTMRTDFLGDCDLFFGLPEALNRGRYLVPRMTRDQLRDAVECPALLLSAQIAPRLLDYLLNELGDRFDRLPVLQHALLRTWDEWQRRGGIGPIDLPDYELAGGIEHALDQDAERALQGLDIDIKITARVFKRLTDTDLSQRRIRSPARITELMAAASADRATVEEIVHRFETDGRSFVHPSADGKPDDPRVDISHESLIRQWDRLRDWVDEERQSRDEYCERVKKARKHERGEAALLQDPELQLAVDWTAKASPSPGWAHRYVADGDFDCTASYLGKSVAARSSHLAEIELARRWQKVWNPIILIIELAVGLWLTSKHAGLLFEWEIGSTKEYLGLLQAGGQVFEDVVLGGSLPQRLLTALKRTMEIMISPNFVRFTCFLGLCSWLNYHGKRLHRRFALPAILRAIESRGGRTPISDEIFLCRMDELDSYAGWRQRGAGFYEDCKRQGRAALLIFILPFLLIGFIEGIYESITETATKSEPSNGFMIVLMITIVIVNWWKSTQPLTSEKQATTGMEAEGIYITDLYGRRLSLARATARYFARIASFVFYGLGFAIQPFAPRRQTFHDWVAGTIVIRRLSAGDSSQIES